MYDKKCLCHNDFSCNHLLLDENNKLTGIIDFGDSGIIDEYCDFLYLLEDSDEEIGHEFGEDIIKIYGDLDIEKAKEYQYLVEYYYPIETIVYGIRNKKIDVSGYGNVAWGIMKKAAELGAKVTYFAGPDGYIHSKNMVCCAI